MGRGLFVHRKQGIEASYEKRPSELPTKFNMDNGHIPQHSGFAPFNAYRATELKKTKY
jgi:hypothetical protein